MNLNPAPKPFSMFELVAGSAALAPVALIALFGLQVLRAQNPSSAVPSSLFSASILSSQPVRWVPSEQFGEPSRNAGVVRKPRPVDLNSDGGSLILPDAAGTKATGSPVADRSPVATTWQLGRQRFADAADAEQRLIEAGRLWRFGDPNSAENRTEASTRDRAIEAGIAPSSSLEQSPSSSRSGGEEAFVGGWADDAGECRQYQNHGAPLVISARAAKTASGKCDFRYIRQEAASRWRIVALCSDEQESWTAHVDLMLAGSNLTWSSERGTAKYVRCLRP
jgi:hypothetical protein